MPEHAPGVPLALGTAQLGMAYGIANRRGRPPREEALAILDTAYAAGIRVLDTAPGYGDAEALVGTWLHTRGVEDVRVIAKLDASVDATDARAVVEALAASTARLGVAPDSVLLHDPGAVARWDAIRPALAVCRARGLVGRVGVSTYELHEFELASAVDDVEVIQAPVNVLDRRLVDSGLLAAALRRGRTIVVRSVFLQGVLLMSPDRLPAPLAGVRAAIERWRTVCARHGLAPEAAALGWVGAVAPGALVLVGCETRDQVLRNVAAAATQVSDAFLADAATVGSVAPGLLDPRQWERRFDAAPR